MTKSRLKSSTTRWPPAATRRGGTPGATRTSSSEARTTARACRPNVESLADAAWWTGRLEEAIELRERAYAAFVDAGEARRAAMLAVVLTMDHALRGSVSVSNGWLARAGRLLTDEPEGVEHGHLALARGMNALDMGELEPATESFARARELGSRFGDRNLETMAFVFEGAVLVWTGEVTEGLAILDEATAAATSGDLDPLATGVIYCVTIDSCQALGDCGRAAEWTDAANRWCERLEVNGFPGHCRIHRAEILRLRGEWPKAEEQAPLGLRGAPRLQPFGHRRRLLRDRRDPAPARGASRRPRRRTARRMNSDVTRSPASPSFGSRRASSTRPPPRSSARSPTSRSTR